MFSDALNMVPKENPLKLPRLVPVMSSVFNQSVRSLKILSLIHVAVREVTLGSVKNKGIDLCVAVVTSNRVSDHCV